MALASADRCAEGAGEAGTGKEAVVPMFVRGFVWVILLHLREVSLKRLQDLS